ncbi:MULTISPECIES: restriction endonuclease [unclassified Pseudomonas]|uniref:restriction endonuclease n=1 Tax=unclassified Pseudomonas TaxID=196821 RepID=UPI0025EDAE03|nr:restriction endonuclease [Pseudomonas sp. UBA5706]
MARKTSNLQALIHLASKLPWWISVLLAALSAFWLHSIAVAPMPTTFDPQHFDKALTASVLRGIATFAQFFVPIIFVGGAIASIVGRRKRRNLLTSVATPGGNTLLSISWHDFELLVGEALRHRGYAVQETGANGPDGGVDLIARKQGETYLVQCKQWRSVQVGVPVVRELYGAMAAEGAVGGFVVTSGKFTNPARAFASGRNVQLIDGAVLRQWIAETKAQGPAPTVQITPAQDAHRVPDPVITTPVVKPASPEAAPENNAKPKAPLCPFCRKTMVTKRARTGKNAGGTFWGCVDFPKCKGIRPIFAPMTVK